MFCGNITTLTHQYKYVQILMVPQFANPACSCHSAKVAEVIRIVGKIALETSVEFLCQFLFRTDIVSCFG